MAVTRRGAGSGLVLTLCCAASFMAALDVFIVNVGLRKVGVAVGETDLANLSWILNGYAIVFAALLVTAGRLADCLGPKVLFLFGLGCFTGGSLACALCDSLWPIVAFRCLQAAGAAALVPSSLGLILDRIPLDRRSRSVQLWSVFGALGAACGPALGGLLVAISWRWVFLVNVPIGILAFAAALRITNVRSVERPPTPDLVTAALLICSAGSLAYGLVQGPDRGWFSALVLGSFSLATATFVLFLLRSRRQAAPMVDPALFRSPAFTWSTASMFVMNVSFNAMLLGFVYWMQEVQGWSSLQVGAAIAPAPAMVGITSIGLRGVLAAVPAGQVAAAGTVLFGLGGIAMGLAIGAGAGYATLLPAWLLVGVGVGLAVPTVIAAGTLELPSAVTSTASAVIQMGRWIGAAIGVALLVTALQGAGAGQAVIHRFAAIFVGAGIVALLATLAAHRTTPGRVPLRSRASSGA